MTTGLLSNGGVSKMVIPPETRVHKTATSLRELQSELNDLFPERENLITQLIYALLTKEHVLIFGKFGTGKSKLMEYFFGSFTGANMFSIEMTKFMTESNIVGIPNPKIMREEGRIWHERAGTMLDAHFAELDEIFDATDYLLRGTLLGILNERRFNRGVQLEKANLHMAVASTNADPQGEIKRSPALGAVVDRFLFQTRVFYLEKDSSRRRMYAKYLSGDQPSVQIPYEDIAEFADSVALVPITDPILLELHNRIIQDFRKKKEVEFSDRRACQALRLVQANALLFGRDEVLPDDFMAVMWALSYGHSQNTQDEFKGVATPLIDKAAGEMKPDVIRTQMKLLEEFERRLTSALEISRDAGTGISTPENLVSARRALVQLDTDVKEIKPSHVTIEDRQKSILASLASARGKVDDLIDGKAATS